MAVKTCGERWGDEYVCDEEPGHRGFHRDSRKAIVDWIANNAAEIEQCTREVARTALLRAIDETERRCIGLVCQWCREGSYPPVRVEALPPYRPEVEWWHEFPGVAGPDPQPPEGEFCKASALHEHRHQRSRAQAGEE